MRFSRSSLGLVSPSSPSVLALVNAIAVQEGPVQNNNPGNLLYAGQAGATGADYRGFAIFSTLQAGQQAEASQIALNANRGTCATGAATTTLAEELACLTPPNQNDTSSYIAAVSAATGIDPNAPLQDVLGGGNGVSNGDMALVGQSDSAVTSVDLTDPTTLLLLAGAGVLAWWAFTR